MTGLRIDHIDGLWDPELLPAAAAGGQRGARQRSYIVVEKILGRDEPLPREWPVRGTTGYDFLNALNGIFVEPGGLAALESSMRAARASPLPFAEICYDRNKQVMQQLFAGEVNALGQHLGPLAAQHRQARDVRLSELMERWWR